jgi:mRNA interferase MazF
VVLVRLDASAPEGEAAKTRPAILISNTTHATRVAISGHGTVIAVPLTSNVERVFPFQLELLDHDTLRTMGLRTPSKAQVEQMRSVSISRVLHVQGRVPGRVAWQLDELIKLHLSLS